MVTQEHNLLLPPPPPPPPPRCSLLLMPEFPHELFFTSHVMPVKKGPMEALKQGEEGINIGGGDAQAMMDALERDTMEEGVMDVMGMKREGAEVKLLLLLLLLLLLAAMTDVRRGMWR